jgi:hypothetical protein
MPTRITWRPCCNGGEMQEKGTLFLTVFYIIVMLIGVVIAVKVMLTSK